MEGGNGRPHLKEPLKWNSLVSLQMPPSKDAASESRCSLYVHNSVDVISIVCPTRDFLLAIKKQFTLGYLRRLLQWSYQTSIAVWMYLCWNTHRECQEANPVSVKAGNVDGGWTERD